MYQEINRIEDIDALEGNEIIVPQNGSFSMDNSKIIFHGTSNILYCENDVHLAGCKLIFSASNSVIYLSSSSHKYSVNITVYNNCTCYIGKDCYFNGTPQIICSEEKNVIIGRQALLSFGVWIRTADPHLIYSAETLERVNPSKSVYIGDHVWIGQNALILKGTRIHSGSIIAGGAVLSGKKVPSNVSYAGNPARQIANNIFWDEKVVHTWTHHKTKLNENYTGKPFIFEHSEAETISFGTIAHDLKYNKTATDRVEYLRKLSEADSYNRFSWRNTELPMTFKRRIKLLLKNWILKILK